MVYPLNVTSEQASIKNKIKGSKHRLMKQPVYKTYCPPAYSRSWTLAKIVCASHCLMVLLVSKHNFTLHKRAFRHAINFWYRWQLPYLPTHCTWRKSFTVEYAFSLCTCGRFSSLQLDDIKDITASRPEENPLLMPTPRQNPDHQRVDIRIFIAETILPREGTTEGEA